MSASDVARQLVFEHGLPKALGLAVSGRMKAKRQRSRKEYQYWVAVAFEIPSLSNESLNGAKAAARIERADTLSTK